MLDRLQFLFGEAFIALRRNTWMTFAAVSTAAMALFLLGGLGYVYFRLNTWLEDLKRDYQIRVFMVDGRTDQQIEEARQKILSIPGVSGVVFVSKEKGLDQMIAENPDIPLADLRESNPLPDVLEVTVGSLDKVEAISGQIQPMDFVEADGVKASDDLRSFVEETVKQSRLLGFLLGGVMLLTGGVLIYNTIRLTIIARRREIRIMELVGATKGTIVYPLLIEGVCHGMLGGLLAFVFLAGTTGVFQGMIQSLDEMAQVPSLPIGQSLAMFLASGAVYGFVCSWLAARRPRREI